jgi:hypothetical protein
MARDRMEFVGREFVPMSMQIPGVKQVSYAHTYPMASGGMDFEERESSVPMFMPTTNVKQASYAQIAWPMASSGMGFVERECSVPMLMPTPDVKQVSYLVTDEVTERGLVGGAK